MKAAFTTWNQRIAPVFDVAGQIVVTHRSDTEGKLEQIRLPIGTAVEKILFLHQLKINVLVCGAMTQSTILTAEAYGIEVLPFIAGWQQEVIECWRQDQPLETRFIMPGCTGRCRRPRRRCRKRHTVKGDDHFNQGDKDNAKQ